MEILAPSSRWHLDMASEKCRLARQFGDGDNRYAFLIEQDKPDEWANIIIAGPAMNELKTRKPVWVRFGNLEPLELEQYGSGSFGEFGAALLTHGVRLNAPEEETEGDEPDEEFLYLPEIDTARFEGVESLTVEQDDRTYLTLQTDNFAAALGAMNVCAQDLLEHWGLDIERHRKVRRWTKMTNLDQVARRLVRDYPTDALRAGEQGTVRFVAIIDEAGEMVECRQSDATELRRLDSPACKALKHARFEPALDADGQPMRSYYATRIRYVLP